MRLWIGVLLVFSLPCGSPGQDAPPPDADVETLRDWAASRLASEAGAFKEMLRRAGSMLQSTLGDDTTAIRETIARLASRAAIHPALVLEAITQASNPVLRRRLCDVLVYTQDATIAPMILDAANNADEDLAIMLVNVVGRLQGKSVTAALVARLGSTTSPPLQGEIVVALARLEAKEALPAARKLIESPDPRARERGVAALGLVGSGKEDVELLRKLAAGPTGTLREAALRGLGRFKGDLDALRVLHDAVTTPDPALVKAALDGLEQAGTKELTAPFLLAAVKTGPPEARERAARLLMRFGNPEGVRIISQPERADAERSPGNRGAQAAAGDRCRELGWYEGAIPFYDRALSGRANEISDQQVLVALARCYARLKRFEDAKRKLRAAHYVSFRSFAEDADFAEMREQPAYREAFK